MDSERGRGFCSSCYRRNKAIFLAGITVKRCPFCGNQRMKPAPVDVLVEYHEREAEADPRHRKRHLEAIGDLEPLAEPTEGLPSHVCESNLCVSDAEVHLRDWFPEEPVCKARGVATLTWNRNQRKIVRLMKRGIPVDGVFTFAMLNRRLTVRPGIAGIDPDYPDSEAAWLKRHARMPRLALVSKREEASTEAAPA